jgi:hypothetical protein
LPDRLVLICDEVRPANGSQSSFSNKPVERPITDPENGKRVLAKVASAFHPQQQRSPL